MIRETCVSTVRSLMKRRFPGEGEKLEFVQKEEEVSVTIPDEAFLVEGLQFIKMGIANDILHFVPEATKVTFTEVYPRKEETGKGKSKSPPEAPAEPEAPEKKEEAKQTA